MKKIFISYRHTQIDFARELDTGLTKNGFQVFRDETEIKTFDSISDTIQQQLANSHAMLVVLSNDYHRSRFCQWELIAAFIASQNVGNPNQHIFIVNPSGDSNLLQTFPTELQDAKFACTVTETIKNLKQQLTDIKLTFSELGHLSLAPCYGRSLTGSPRFVGREKVMWNIHSALQGSTKPMVTGHVGPNIVQLSGMGGTGKTLLAEEYALRFSAAYPGGVFWLDAYGSFNPENPDIEAFKAACIEQFRKVAESFGLTPSADSSFESLQAMIRHAIDQQNKHCLWIVDDIPWGLVEYLNDVKNWFSPHPQLASTLLTTRSKEYNNIGIELPLEVLDYEEAELLLENNHIKLTEQSEEAKVLIERLGRHALAVDVAGAAIYKLNLSIRVYLNDLDANMDQLIDIPREIVATLPSGCEKSIVTSFFRSISKLSESSLDFLRLAANLAPAAINQEFIQQVFTNSNQQDEKGANHSTQLSLLGCEQLNLARNYQGKWSVHALVSATIQYLEEDAGTRGKQLRSSAIQLLTEKIRYDMDDKSTQALALEVEHARYLTQEINVEAELNLLKQLGDFDHYRGYPQLALKDCLKEREITETLLGIDHPDTMNSMSNLASALNDMGDFPGARALQEQVLERRKVILGVDDPAILTSMNNLASTMGNMGDLAGARALQEQVLERSKVILGADDPATLTSMNNLASTLRDLGDILGARALQEEVLERSKLILGADDPATMICIANLSSTLRDMGDLPGARVLQEEVLESSKLILGADNPTTLAHMYNLALTLSAMRNYPEARVLHEQVLEHRQEKLGTDHPDTLSSMYNLALTLSAMGNYPEARVLHEQVLEHRKEKLGIDHPDTLSSMYNLALTLCDMGDYQGARSLQEQELEYRKATLGADHPEILSRMSNLALTLRDMGDYQGARVLVEKVLERRKVVLGVDHPSTLSTMDNLAFTLSDMGYLTGARALQEQVLERRKSILEVSDPDITTSAWNLFITLDQMNDRVSAQMVLDNYLFWLLKEGLELHSAKQQQIRDKLKEVIRQ